MKKGKRLIWTSIALAVTGLIIYFILGIIPIPPICASQCYFLKAGMSVSFGFIGAGVIYFSFFD